ncbi:MAG: flagellar basal body L-ring protein FlgH [Verrucomicrobia bacterium]|nr:flagellar basal body L-ring protein FlgH [Verrucomicrobiota bacterium]
MKTQLKSYSKTLLSLAVVSMLAGSAQADSLWRPEIKLSLIADKKARAVGDTITVVVQENSTASKDSNTKTSKKTDLNAKIDSFLFSPGASKFMTKKGALPAFALNSDNSFDGGGKVNQSETIGARFGATVRDVLPNGNLIVEAIRNTKFSNESQTIILRGTVRPYDITPSNTVLSYHLADVSLSIRGAGAVSNVQRKGWFTRAWDALTPF